MSTSKNGGPAFPHSSQPLDAQGNPMMENHTEWGMSLRDWFAGKALTGTLSANGNSEQFHAIRIHAAERGVPVALHIAQLSYELADAMIEARNGTKKEKTK